MTFPARHHSVDLHICMCFVDVDDVIVVQRRKKNENYNYSQTHFPIFHMSLNSLFLPHTDTHSRFKHEIDLDSSGNRDRIMSRFN